MSIKQLLISILFLSFPVLLTGQADRVSEKEVNIQKTFIEANREKILGNYEDAANLFREVLAQDANNGAAAYELARVYDVLEKNKEALVSIKVAVSAEPLNSWYLTYMADLYESAQQFEEAAEVYASLIKYYPDQNYYYYKQAYYLVKDKEPSKAIKVYDQLERNIGITEDLTKKKFRLYLALNNQKKATGELKKLVRAYPSAIDYRMELAQFYESQGNKEAANKIYEEILAIDPNFGPASIALVQKKSGVKKDGLLVALEPIFRNPETDIDSKIQQLIPYIQKVAETGDQELGQKTIVLAQVLEDVHPDEAKSFSAYGDLLYITGNLEAALEKYKRALQLDKSVYTLWEQFFYLLRDLGQFSELVSRTAEAQDYFPNRATVLLFRGIGLEGTEQYASAIVEYKQALLMTRRVPQLQQEILHHLGQANTSLNKWEQAEKNFEAALAINPKDPHTLSSYASSLANNNNLNKAFQLIEEANELSPQNPGVMTIYGKLYLQKGELEKGQQMLEGAQRLGGNRFDTYEYLGDLYHAQKDYGKAKEYWQRALDMGGKKSILEKKIDAL